MLYCKDPMHMAKFPRNTGFRNRCTTVLYLLKICVNNGPPRGFQGPRATLQNEAPSACDRSEQKGQKAKESGGLNLEALLEPTILRSFASLFKVVR